MCDEAELERLTNELMELTPPDQKDPLLERAYNFRTGKISNNYPLMDRVTTVNMLIRELSERLTEIRAKWLE